MHRSPLVRAALLALAAALCGADVMAQAPVGCRDTCPTAYSLPQRSVVRLAGGCSARITWIARPRCDVGWDLAVLRVEPLTDACGGVALSRLLGEATDSLIAGRETGFFWMAGYRDSCVFIGSIRRAACWGYRVECGDTIVVPCDSSSCCESPVLLCTDAVFRRKVVCGPSSLRAPCDQRRACVSTCGAATDSNELDPINDTTGARDREGDPIGDTTSARDRDRNHDELLSARERDGDRSAPLSARDRDGDHERDHDRDGFLAARSRNGASTDPALDALPPWPWRDRRPVRAPVREVRAEAWRLAHAETVREAWRRAHAERAHDARRPTVANSMRGATERSSEAPGQAGRAR